MTLTLKSTLSTAVLCGGLLLSAISRADTVNVVLTPSTLTAAPGGTITFSGVLSAPSTNGAPIYINGGDITFFGPSDVITDPTDLVLNYLNALSPGSSVNGDFFTVSVPTGETPGLYSGILDVDGGLDFTSVGTIGTVNFNVDIAAPSSVTPEPSSYLLLASGLAGVLVAVQRQRSPVH